MGQAGPAAANWAAPAFVLATGERRREATMARRVTATFSDRAAADRAVAALIDLGASREQISTLVRGEHQPTGSIREHADEMIEPAREVGDSGAPLTTTD